MTTLTLMISNPKQLSISDFCVVVADKRTIFAVIISNPKLWCIVVVVIEVVIYRLHTTNVVSNCSFVQIRPHDFIFLVTSVVFITRLPRVIFFIKPSNIDCVC